MRAALQSRNGSTGLRSRSTARALRFLGPAISAAIAVAAALTFATVAHSQESSRWLQITSPHFEMFSSATADETRQLISDLESLHSFFAETFGWTSPKPLPVRVIVFRSVGESRRFHGGLMPDAYWKGYDRDYLVIGGTGERKNRPIAGLYAALLGESLGINKISWLRRGFWVLYSTFVFQDETFVLGVQPGPALRRARGRNPWLPLTAILEGYSNTAKSVAFTDSTISTVHYAQAWALVHMLHLHPDYASRLTPFLLAAASSPDQATAFESIYRKSLDQVTEDLTDYIDNRIASRRFTVAPPLQPDSMHAERPTDIDREVALGGLLVLAGKTSQGRERLAALEAADPDSSAVAEALAYLSRHEGDLAAAAKHFERAVEAGSQNPRLFLDYARVKLEARAENSETERLFRRAIDISGDYPEARIAWANALLHWGRPEEALKQLQTVEETEPWLRPAYDEAMAEVRRALAGP